MEEIIKELIKQNKTISTMESCTGGGVANAITNVEGASDVFSFSAVTYSNEFKIKMGVPSEVIEKYTVYSKETAQAMAQAISLFTNSDYGVGITGKLNRIDKNNLIGDNNVVYISIYNNNKYINQTISIGNSIRKESKQAIIQIITELLLKSLRGDNNV